MPIRTRSTGRTAAASRAIAAVAALLLGPAPAIAQPAGHGSGHGAGAAADQGLAPGASQGPGHGATRGAGDPAGHGAGHAHGQGGRAAAPAHAAVEACQAEFDAVVAQGRGFGMAFAADQNRYPGPLHVLELSAHLGLSADQEARVRALLEAMYAESIPRGARLLDAERALRRLFETGAADEPAVRAAVAAVERARADVRAVHLVAHLRTRDVLTAAQRERYHEARWPARAPGR